MFRKTTIASALWLLISGVACAASINGTVTSELTSQPLPVEEYPVVALYKYDTKANLWNYFNSTTTDQSGNFKLTDLPAGYYHIYTSAAHYNGESCGTCFRIPHGHRLRKIRSSRKIKSCSASSASVSKKISRQKSYRFSR